MMLSRSIHRDSHDPALNAFERVTDFFALIVETLASVNTP